MHARVGCGGAYEEACVLCVVNVRRCRYTLLPNVHILLRPLVVTASRHFFFFFFFLFFYFAGVVRLGDFAVCSLSLLAFVLFVVCVLAGPLA